MKGNSSTINGIEPVSSDDMDPDVCRKHCRKVKTDYVLLTEGTTCMCISSTSCDNSPDTLSTVDDSSCITVCVGDSTYKCGANDYSSLYIVTNAISFLDVKEAVSLFECIFSPGTDLLLYETLRLLFVVNEASYPGVEIDFGRNEDLLYLLKRFISTSYSEIGSYLVCLKAMNEINYIKECKHINVFEELSDLSLYALDLYSPNISINFTLTLSSGNNVTCTIDFGDGSKQEIIGIGVVKEYVFTHVYTDGGVRTLNITCSNSRSLLSLNKTFQVEDYIDRLEVITPKLIHMRDNITLKWAIVSVGSFISVKNRLYTAYINETQFLQFTTDKTYGEITITENEYTTTGNFLVVLSVNDDRLGVFEGSSLTKIRESLDNINQTSVRNGLCLPVLHAISFHFTVGKGSQFYTEVDFGDGGVLTVYTPNGVREWVSIFNHTFKQPGQYNVTILSWNELGKVINWTMVTLENEIKDISLTIINATSPDIKVQMIFELTSGTPHPTNAMIECSLGDSTTDIDTQVQFNSQKKLLFDHQFATDGYYTFKCKLTNCVSDMLFQEIVIVGEEIDCLTLSAPQFILIDSEVTFTADVCKGSSVSYDMHFGDGSSGSSVTLHGSSPSAAWSVRHSFDKVGTYHPSVKAYNMWSNIIFSIPGGVHVLDAIRGIVISVPSKVKPGHHAFILIYVTHLGTNPCFEVGMGDGNALLIGKSHCLHKNPDLVNNYWGEFTNNMIYIPYMYKQQGNYCVTVLGKNEVSSEYKKQCIRVDQDMCHQCSLSVSGLGLTIKTALDFLRSYPICLSVMLANNPCDPPRQIVYKWLLVKLFSNTTYETEYHEQVSLDISNERSLCIKANVLGYFKYKATVVAFPSGASDVACTATGYFQVHPTPLITVIKGGPRRTVIHGEQLTMDASASSDPDEGQLTATWICHKEGESFDNLNTGGCGFETGKRISSTALKIELPTSGLVLNQTYTFRLTISVGEKSNQIEQRVRVISSKYSGNIRYVITA